MNLAKIRNSAVRRALTILIAPFEIAYVVAVYVGKGFAHAAQNIEYSWRGDKETTP